MSSALPLLGDLEIAVLEDLWAQPASDAKSVHARVGTARGISHNTVQSTLERLFRKRLLRREKISHAFVYTAALSRAQLLNQLVESAVRRVGGDASELVLSAFVDLAARADAEQLQRIEALIAQRRAERDAGNEA